jgi:hypothetical protein
MREMNARFNGRCLGCSEGIKAGERIVFQRGVGSYHADRGCGDVYWGNEFGRQEAEQERAAYQAEMDWEGAMIAREEAEYQRGYHGTAAIQAISTAGSAWREQLYAEQEAQWACEGFDG